MANVQWNKTFLSKGSKFLGFSGCLTILNDFYLETHSVSKL